MLKSCRTHGAAKDWILYRGICGKILEIMSGVKAHWTLTEPPTCEERIVAGN